MLLCDIFDLPILTSSYPHSHLSKNGESKVVHLIRYYELLKPHETITGNWYQMQLMPLNQTLKEKQPQYQERHDKVILQHDNTWPHVARPVKTYLETLDWEVLPHPSYSLDVAPSD